MVEQSDALPEQQGYEMDLYLLDKPSPYAKPYSPPLGLTLRALLRLPNHERTS